MIHIHRHIGELSGHKYMFQIEWVPETLIQPIQINDVKIFKIEEEIVIGCMNTETNVVNQSMMDDCIKMMMADGLIH